MGVEQRVQPAIRAHKVYPELQVPLVQMAIQDHKAPQAPWAQQVTQVRKDYLELLVQPVLKVIQDYKVYRA